MKLIHKLEEKTVDTTAKIKLAKKINRKFVLLTYHNLTQ